MSRTVRFQYDQPAAEVAALLQDSVFLRYRSEASGERNIDVKVEQTNEGVRITVAREKDVDVPAFARMVVGNASRAVETTVWRQDGERWLANYTIEVSGLPVKTVGTSTLAPSGAGCLYTSTFEVTARIPLVGGRIENLFADGLQEQLMANVERNVAAMVRDNARGSRSFIDELREKASKAQQG